MRKRTKDLHTIAVSLQKLTAIQALTSDYNEIALKVKLGIISEETGAAIIKGSITNFQKIMAEIE